MGKRIKKSVVISKQNYNFIKAIADTVYRDEEEPDGNFSKALDLVIFLLRERSNFSTYLSYMEYKARFDGGERTKEVLNKIKEFELLAFINLTKKSK